MMRRNPTDDPKWRQLSDPNAHARAVIARAKGETHDAKSAADD